MLFAAEIATQSMGEYAVGAVVVGAVGVLAFLVRNAFEGLSRAIAELGSKIEHLVADLARGDGTIRVLEQKYASHDQRLDAKGKRLDKIEARLERLEQQRRDDSEGIAR